MRRKLQQRFWAADGDPGPLAWSIAVISLVLPVAGLGLCLYGGFWWLRGDADGRLWLGIGAGALVLDILIDFVWAHPGVSVSDQPQLNRRVSQLIDRRITLREPIEGGAGRVKVGDTIWAVEGPDLPEGALVRVTGARHNVLIVEAAPGREAVSPKT